MRLITGGSLVPAASRHSPDASGIISKTTRTTTVTPMRRRRIRSRAARPPHCRDVGPGLPMSGVTFATRVIGEAGE